MRTKDVKYKKNCKPNLKMDINAEILSTILLNGAMEERVDSVRFIKKFQIMTSIIKIYQCHLLYNKCQ